MLWSTDQLVILACAVRCAFLFSYLNLIKDIVPSERSVEIAINYQFYTLIFSYFYIFINGKWKKWKSKEKKCNLLKELEGIFRKKSQKF